MSQIFIISVAYHHRHGPRMLSFLFSRSQVGLLLLRHFSGVYVEHGAKKGGCWWCVVRKMETVQRNRLENIAFLLYHVFWCETHLKARTKKRGYIIMRTLRLYTKHWAANFFSSPAFPNKRIIACGVKRKPCYIIFHFNLDTLTVIYRVGTRHWLARYIDAMVKSTLCQKNPEIIWQQKNRTVSRWRQANVIRFTYCR